MFLQKIVIDNVRSIEHLELPFVCPDGTTRKWTFLLGENGTGKSTVLRCAALIMAGSEALKELLGNPDSWVRTGKQECAVQAEIVTASGHRRSVALRLRRGDDTKTIFERNKESLDELDRALAHSARNYMTIGYGVSRRFSRGKSLGASQAGPYRHARAQSVATLFSADAALQPLESWAMDLDYRRKDGLKVVRSALDALLPGVKFARIDKERRELMFRTADGDIPLPLLSDGYQNVAAWCGDLLYRITEVFADHKNPLAARGLLLIDEIDLHLHPLWKRQLVDFLSAKLKNFQIIATTHSALTVHQADEGELYVLKRREGEKGTRLTAYPGAPRNLLLHQLLLSPLFGLETADSRPVEDMKNEYRALRGQRSLSSSDKTRFTTLKAELQELPEWTRPTPQEERRTALLAKIERVLGPPGANGTDGAPQAAARKGGAKKKKAAKKKTGNAAAAKRARRGAKASTK